ncbi:DUF2924 domain-containing protein [Sphingomonas sp.]|uniref:DUF2924 domain-containing protein n=1 Tax=Sphingomonas sp. TaxID=28214 RepID=UPI002DEBA225|nr:DUF2924 domain-containing protein [Sphingomonas sp.]
MNDPVPALGSIIRNSRGSNCSWNDSKWLPHFLRHEVERGIAYRLQERAWGGLPIDLCRELDGRATISVPGQKPEKTGPRLRLKPGNRLVRRWRGTTYSVLVTEGGFLFESRSYSSLSTIATEITGTRWSGPRFFGLTERAA